jgi:hypothetical protein
MELQWDDRCRWHFERRLDADSSGMTDVRSEIITGRSGVDGEHRASNRSSLSANVDASISLQFLGSKKK